MDAERARTYLLTLPHVVETMQWGVNLVFWVGDKAIGGKMFALLNLEPDGAAVIWFAATPDHAAELLEREGLMRAPYLGRLGWIAAERWGALREREWKEEFESAHAVVFARIPPRTRGTLKMPAKSLDKLIVERRKVLAGKAAGKKTGL